MNQFDQISETLTDIMIDLDRYPDQQATQRLFALLEDAHAEACRASADLRNGGAHHHG